MLQTMEEIKKADMNPGMIINGVDNPNLLSVDSTTPVVTDADVIKKEEETKPEVKAAEKEPEKKAEDKKEEEKKVEEKAKDEPPKASAENTDKDKKEVKEKEDDPTVLIGLSDDWKGYTEDGFSKTRAGFLELISRPVPNLYTDPYQMQTIARVMDRAGRVVHAGFKIYDLSVDIYGNPFLPRVGFGGVMFIGGSMTPSMSTIVSVQLEAIRIMTTLHHAPTLPTIEQDSTSAELWELCSDAPINRASDDAPDYNNDNLDFAVS